MNWKPICEWFKKVWDHMRAAFTLFIEQCPSAAAAIKTLGDAINWVGKAALRIVRLIGMDTERVGKAGAIANIGLEIGSRIPAMAPAVAALKQAFPALDAWNQIHNTATSSDFDYREHKAMVASGMIAPDWADVTKAYAPGILQSGRYSLIFSDDSVLRASCNAAGDLVSEIKLRGNSQYFNNIVFGIVAIVAKRNGDNEENYEHICDILAKGEPCQLDSMGVRYQLERDADRSEFTCSLAA